MYVERVWMIGRFVSPALAFSTYCSASQPSQYSGMYDVCGRAGYIAVRVFVDLECGISASYIMYLDTSRIMVPL